jgi:AraC family transcriptional regulator
MEPTIKTLTEKRLAGKKMRMSFSTNKTRELWLSFIPELKKIRNKIGLDFYSVEVYDISYFDNYNPEKEFDKWAAVETIDFDAIPGEMETITLPDGLYAVFLHKGPASTGTKTYQYIFGTWLPSSGFLLDNRPHFAIMGEKYKSEDPDSEEEIWIPVKPKK